MSAETSAAGATPAAPTPVAADGSADQPWPEETWPEIVLAVGFVIALATFPIKVDQIFGLPAHPLFIHVPVILIPLVALSAIALAVRPVWRRRYGVALGAVSVVTLGSTMLSVGAGQKFREVREARGIPSSPTLRDHYHSADQLRIIVVVLTALVLATVFADRRRILVGHWARNVLLVLVVVFAGLSTFSVIRTGHLGAKSVWSRQGGPPGGGGGGFPRRGGLPGGAGGQAPAGQGGSPAGGGAPSPYG
jgi:hypothetical protein